jgi:hypothetical protein
MGLNGGAGIPVIAATATGNPLTFETDMIKPLKSLVIPFTPIQDGSGDPSPDNVRPISGFDGVKIRGAGENLLDINNLKSLGWSWDSSNPSYVGYIKTLQNRTSAQAGGLFLEKVNIVGQVTLLTRMRVGSRSNFIFEYSDGTSSESANIASTESQVFRYYRSLANKTLTRIRFTTVGGSSSTGRISQIQVVRGAVSEFVDDPYPTTIPITFTDPSTGDPITVYDGTLILNEDGSVDLVSAWAMREYDGSSDESWDITTRERARVIISPNAKYASSSSASIICNKLKSASGNQAELGTIDNIAFVAYANRLGIRLDSTYTTVEQVRAWLQSNPIQMCYELASPLTYHFDNVGQLITVVGTNNIWTDTNGTNIATYLKHQS